MIHRPCLIACCLALGLQGPDGFAQVGTDQVDGRQKTDRIESKGAITKADVTSAENDKPEQGAANFTPPSIPAIDQAMQGFIENDRISGAVTLVAHQGRVVHLSGVGMRDRDAQEPMKPWTRFSIASMTKPITATAVMILQEQGKLRVTDEVAKYIPEFAEVTLRDGKSPSRGLTLRDLLTHTSGLSGNQVFSGSLEDHVKELTGRPLAFDPGTRWQYGPGISVAGRIVEIVSQQPFQTFLQERIFDPLEMENTSFYPDEKKQRMLARLYKPGPDGKSLVVAENHITDFQPENGPNPSGGLVSTARDLFKFYQMVLNRGQYRGKRILSKESVEAMTSLSTGDLETGFTPGNGWGLGWCLVREPQGVTEMLSPGTFGHGGAFGTQGWVDPATKTIYVLLIQRTQMGNSDASSVRQTFQQVASDSILP